jgi:hypothetical protein
MTFRDSKLENILEDLEKCEPGPAKMKYWNNANKRLAILTARYKLMVSQIEDKTPYDDIIDDIPGKIAEIDEKINSGVSAIEIIDDYLILKQSIKNNKNRMDISLIKCDTEEILPTITLDDLINY